MVRRSEGLRKSAKTSAIWGDTGPSPSRIAQAKWLEIQEEEYANRIINSIREDIIQGAMNTLYANYLENRSYSFVVDCAHTAWLQLFNWMNLKCSVDQNLTSVKERWTGDEEPATVPKDNWVCGHVAIRKMSAQSVETEACEAMCSQEDISHLLPKNISVLPLQQTFETLTESVANKIVRIPSAEAPSRSVIAEASDEDRKEEEEAEEAAAKIEVEAGESDRSEVLSIFTRTINMPRHKLPIARSSSGQNHSVVKGTDVCKQKSWRSWRLDSVQAPRKLSVERLPANRLDIKYALIADPRSSSNARMDIKKKIPSKLFTRESEGFKPKRESKNLSQL